MSRSTKMQAGNRKPRLGSMRVLLVNALILAVVLSIGSSAAAAEKRTLSVAAVQMRSSRIPAENALRIAASIHRCATNGAHIVVFPECALTGYYEEVVTNLTQAEISRAVEPVAAACRTAKVYAIVGTAFRQESKLFDSALIITPAGEILDRYDKIQLAERWPDPGEKLLVFQADGVPCSIIICHDERYPELVRLPVLAGARVILYLSHESGLGEERKIAPYRAQIQARAVENTVFVVQANAPANPDNTGSHGQSRIVAPDGNIIQEASMRGEDVVTATLDLRQASAANAKKSATHGPLKEWWAAGVSKVKICR